MILRGQCFRRLYETHPQIKNIRFTQVRVKEERTNEKAIMYVDRNWGIGYQEQITGEGIASDMKFFRQTTGTRCSYGSERHWKVSQMDFHLKIVRILCLLEIRIMQ